MERIALFTLAAACVCSAQQKAEKGASAVLWEPPVPSWPQHLPQATMKKEPISTFQLAGMPIMFEKTKLEDVRSRFGGTIGTRGDAGDSRAWLCYQGSNGDRHWIVWLTSGEIEGHTSINGVEWETLSADESTDSRCSTLPKDSGGIQLPLAIYPGMTGQEARQVLGQPTMTRNNVLIFSYERRKSMFRPKFTVQNLMAVALRDDIVQEIDVERTTTN